MARCGMPDEKYPDMVKSMSNCNRCGGELGWNGALGGWVHLSTGIGPCPSRTPKRDPKPGELVAYAALLRRELDQTPIGILVLLAEMAARIERLEAR